MECESIFVTLSIYYSKRKKKSHIFKQIFLLIILIGEAVKKNFILIFGIVLLQWATSD